MNRRLPALAAAIFTLVACNQTDDSSLRLRPDNIDKITEALTLEEKCHLVIGNGQKDVLDSTDQIMLANCKNLVPGCAGTTYPIERLGIPAIVLADGPAGLRIRPTRENDENTYYCTGFPVGTLLAASWDPQLARTVGEAMGNEVLEYGVDVLLAPGANIHRNPLCGRNFEYYSEDPLLSGTIAAAMINGVQSNGVGTSLKHFAVNNCEINRLACDSRVSIKALREIYLKNWEVALGNSEPWTIMTSYNYLNGVYTSESKDLIQDVLRGDWGYKGCLMTDWGGGQHPIEQIEAGNDMIQPGKGWQYEQILTAVKNGQLAEADLDACVKNILELIVRTPSYAGYAYSNHPDLAAHAQVARESASEGFVLLKNDNGALPMKEGSSVAMFGVNSYRLSAGGTGSGDVNKAYVVNLDEGISGNGLVLDATVDAAYKTYTNTEFARIDAINKEKKWYQLHEVPEEMDAAKLAVSAANTADQAVITITRNSGEGTDRHIKGDFTLTDAESALIKNVCEAFHAKNKNVSVILNIAGVIETSSWKEYPDAILVAWQCGQEAGNAIADALTGAVNPSGRLPMTFPASYSDVPSQNFPALEINSGNNDSYYRYSKEKLYEVKDVDYIDYKEDIFVGYRHYCSHDVRASYPFGFGLSYTSFEIQNLNVTKTRSGWKIKINVANVGSNPGRDVVQLYSFGNPANPQKEPVRQLKGFAKTSILNPGESQTVVIDITPHDLASFDEDASAWVTYAGVYAMAVTADAEDYGMSFGIDIKDEVRKEVNRALLPVCPRPETVPDGQLFIDAE